MDYTNHIQFRDFQRATATFCEGAIAVIGFWNGKDRDSYCDYREYVGIGVQMATLDPDELNTLRRTLLKQARDRVLERVNVDLPILEGMVVVPLPGTVPLAELEAKYA